MLKYLWVIIVVGGLIENAFAPRVTYVKESKVLMLHYNKENEDSTITRAYTVLFKL